MGIRTPDLLHAMRLRRGLRGSGGGRTGRLPAKVRAERVWAAAREPARWLPEMSPAGLVIKSCSITQTRGQEGLALARLRTHGRVSVHSRFGAALVSQVPPRTRKFPGKAALCGAASDAL